MTKRLLQVLISISVLLFACQGSSFAAPKTSIAVIVQTDRFIMSDEAKKQLDKELAELFPKANYRLVEDAAVSSDLSKRLENRLLKDPAAKVQATLLDIARKYDYDSILLLFYKLNTASNNSNFINWSKKAQMTLVVQMMHKETGKVIYANNITREGRQQIKKARDLSDINAIASETAKRCNEHLFTALELPYGKRVLELL